MPGSDDSFAPLREAIEQLAADDAAALLAEARIEARARVRAKLTDALAHSMLDQIEEQLSGRPGPAPPKRDVPAGTPPAAPADTGEPAWYVYGVTSADAELSGDLRGVDPARPVTTLEEGALSAVTSKVPLAEFDEERLRVHLADMAWVEATARAHEEVLEHVRELTTVIPMRMCTVYRTDGGVREMLRRESGALSEALDRLDGKAEWGVKVFADPEQAADSEDAVAETGSPGAAYIERKRTERDQRERAVELLDELGAQIHERLSAVASDALVIPLQRPEASGHGGEMVLNGVYLVPDDEREAFHAAVQALQVELGPQGIEIVPTGPWPAYNFVPGTIGAAW